MDLPRPGVRRPPVGGAVRGIVLMAVAALLFSSMHATIRHVSSGMHPFEVAFFRNVFALLFVLPWFLRLGFAPLRTQRFGMHLLRTAFNVVAMLCFFYALSITPLSEVTALNFTAPIFATLLAALILGEVVRARRWSAIAIGFLGTIVILRPGFAEVGLGEILALSSALTWAFALLAIKSLSRTETSLTIITYLSLLMLPLSLLPALFVWQWPSPEQLVWLALIGLLGAGGQYLMTESLSLADTSVVMPIDFTKLIWVSLIAYLAFGEVPDVFTWIGGIVIFGSTFYIALREQQIARRDSRAAAAPTIPEG
jgi:drug/metabolite transporter (DMT)-like permease